MHDPAKQDKPAWAREDAFAIKPSSGAYGFLDGKGRDLGFESLDDLKKYLDTGRGSVAWLWTPGEDRVVAPEEVPELADTLRKRRLILAQGLREDAWRSLPFTSAVLAASIYGYLTGATPFGFGGLEVLVFAAFLFFFFTARPFWESRKVRISARRLTKEQISSEVPEARFDLWMESQKAPVTLGLTGLLAGVWLVQMLTPGLGIAEAGLDKIRYYTLGEHWRLFTGAYLHGNLIHFFLNAIALWYLGRRVEILARWPQLLAVMLTSIIGSGWATIQWWKWKISRGELEAVTSVGISGAVCGLLGFLLVFETLHRPLVPRPARRRLLAVLLSLVVVGVIGFKFIDNAAHFGGLLMGALYSFLVFPKSSSPERPRILGSDYAVGGLAAGLIGGTALVTMVLLIW